MADLNPGHPALLTRNGLVVALQGSVGDAWAWQHTEAVKSMAARPIERALIDACLGVAALVAAYERQQTEGQGQARKHNDWLEVWPDGFASEQIGSMLDGLCGWLNMGIGRLDGGTVDRWLRAVAARVGYSMDAAQTVWESDLVALRAGARG